MRMPRPPPLCVVPRATVPRATTSTLPRATLPQFYSEEHLEKAPERTYVSSTWSHRRGGRKAAARSDEQGGEAKRRGRRQLGQSRELVAAGQAELLQRRQPHAAELGPEHLRAAVSLARWGLVRVVRGGSPHDEVDDGGPRVRGVLRARGQRRSERVQPDKLSRPETPALRHRRRRELRRPARLGAFPCPARAVFCARVALERARAGRACAAAA